MKELIPKALIDPVKDIVIGRKQTIAVAESATAGLLQAICSAATDASMFFQGGITAYNIGQKILHLGVEPIHAEQCNCVSGTVASQMALGVCSLFRSDWGIGITGYATPVPESGNEVFAWCAIAFKGEIMAQEKIVPAASGFFPVQREYAIKTIELLKANLLKDQ
jgi:nicotinamide-nucleotide amidase